MSASGVLRKASAARLATHSSRKSFSSVSGAIDSDRVPISNLERDAFLPYSQLRERLDTIRRRLDRPLTLSEKLLYSHLCDPAQQDLERGKSILRLKPDRVAIHDANATMAMLQFISAGLPKTALPTSIHCDHLIVAEQGAQIDLDRARTNYSEVYQFLSSASLKYGIGFWRPGAGIIHTVIFEHYAFPGALLIGTDSHTPHAGGMGMLGIGVGGSDAVDAMAALPWELACPKIVGVKLTGKLSGWATAKDIILELAGRLTVLGGKGKILEFYGPGAATLGATEMSTVCNMSAEVGATSCLFPFSASMERYLISTKRASIADAARREPGLLLADYGSEQYYDEVMDLDLSRLEPRINGPYTPDLSHRMADFAADVSQNTWPKSISQTMIGSCTNSSYQDLSRAANMFRQAREVGLKPKAPIFITAGSETVRATVERDGILQEFVDAGAVILSNACGPCVGQWSRPTVAKGTRNTVVSSFNRNFTGRHDGNPGTHSFVTSPEMVAAFAFGGTLDYNPLKDPLIDANGRDFLFTPPPSTGDVPASFEDGTATYQSPSHDPSSIRVAVSPESQSLQLLQPFKAWEKGNAKDMTVLIKVKGKCTTDHISPAGPWYKYRGHLENISNNLLTVAENAFLPSSSRGVARSAVDGSVAAVPQVAKSYRDAGIKWCIIGDTYYGEGSSREHAALEPRYMGGVAVIAKSLARIHETNLKKQGMLALTFADPSAYDQIEATDKVSVEGVEDMQPERQLVMRVCKQSGEVWESLLDHTYHAGEIRWLMHGSALNAIKAVKNAE